jgi:hypothetical protein
MPDQEQMIETLCRLICVADGVDPDRQSVGCGGLIPRDQPYTLWQARRNQAETILQAGYMPQSMLRHEIAGLLLAKAHECDAQAKALGRPDGSTDHMCANVWRAATALVSRDIQKNPAP